MNLIISEMVW